MAHIRLGDTRAFFDAAAGTYDVYSRLTRECANAIVESVHAVLNSIEATRVLDVGAGTGFFDALLLARHASLTAVLLDNAPSMLASAKEKLAELEVEPRTLLVLADAYAMPFPDEYFSCITMYYVIHLLDKTDAAFRELRRVLASGGSALILTYDPEDQKRQLYHSLFPRFFEIDSARFAPSKDLENTLARAGFHVSGCRKFPYAIRYESVDDVLALVRSKPFSTFSFYEEREFRDGLEEFERQLRALAGNGPVANESSLSLWEIQRPEGT